MRNTALAFTACSLLAVCAAPAGADDVERPLVSIQTLQSTPLTTEPVTMIASSSGLGLTYAWDLDGDGSFGDATAARVEKAYPEGRYTVAVLATDKFGRTATEARSLTVADPNLAPTLELTSPYSWETGEKVAFHVMGTDLDGQVDKFEVDLDGDGVYEISGPGKPFYKQTKMFEVEGVIEGIGDRVIRARVTDDHGVSVVATSTMRVHDAVPSAIVAVAGDEFEQPPLAGRTATVWAGSSRSGARKYEFDLDGDGTYELDNGTDNSVETTFTAGPHDVGARVTDVRGVVFAPRSTFFVYQPTDVWAERFHVDWWPMSARVGELTDLAIQIEPYSYKYTAELDADGDGDFDDGTVTTVGGEVDTTPESSVAHLKYTFPAAGTYQPRVRVTRAGQPTRIFSSTITVGPGETDHTPMSAIFDVHSETAFGQPRRIEAGSLRGTVLTWDLDGDGAFDDTPGWVDYAFSWTFTKPTTMALKISDPGSGDSAVSTVEVNPPSEYTSPSASLKLARPLVAGQGIDATYTVEDAHGVSCCVANWDADGDGEYDDARGAFPALTASGAEQTVGLLTTDGAGHGATVRKTFTAGTRPPSAAFDVDGTTVIAKAADPDGHGLAELAWDLDGDQAFDDAKGATARVAASTRRVGLMVKDTDGDVGVSYRSFSATRRLKLRADVTKTTLAKALAKGLRVAPGCDMACRATVTVTTGKATAKRLKLRSARLGKKTGSGKVVTVKLASKARKALQHVRSVKLTVAIEAKTAGGRSGTTKRALTFKR